MEKKDIASYSFEELQEEMLAIGEKGFRSRQIYSWIHEKLVDDFEEMTNLPKTLRQKLEAAYEIRRVEMEKRQISFSPPVITEAEVSAVADVLRSDKGSEAGRGGN